MEGRREVIHRLLKNKTKNQMEIRIWPMKIPEKKNKKLRIHMFHIPLKYVEINEESGKFYCISLKFPFESPYLDINQGPSLQERSSKTATFSA